MAMTRTVRSKTTIGEVYRVSIDDGVFSCSCPDFVYRGHECKHIKKVKMQLAGEKQKNKLLEVDL